MSQNKAVDAEASESFQSALDDCANEPIRIPGGIQPHGALVVVDPSTLAVLQASSNLGSVVGQGFPDVGSTLLAGITESLGSQLQRWGLSSEQLFLRTMRMGDRDLQVSAHRSAQGLLVEFEDPPVSHERTLEAVYPSLRDFVDQIGEAKDLRAIGGMVVEEIRRLTGFNRVMLYAFDDTGDGTVVAEDGDGELPSYLGLRFPASDIPAQARELYRLNRLRLIPDASYVPSAIEPSLSPVDGKPLDLSMAALRSVSPIHLEYMRNMGTGASMSISVLVDGDLWGLISCHNKQPLTINAQIRTACDFLGQIISLQIGSRERAELADHRIALKHFETRLLAKLSASQSFQEALVEQSDLWLRLVDADGAVLISDGHFMPVGITPSLPEIQELVLWLWRERAGELYCTDSLSAHWPPAEGFADVASGLVAIQISQIHPSYILWFRQEVVRTVRWGGDPRKDIGATRLNPRRSFESWKQLVRHTSKSWSLVEQESAASFRNAIINFVLRRAEEKASLTSQLQQSNSELEAFSYSVSHDLRAPFRHIAGYAQLLKDRESSLDPKSAHYLTSIVEATTAAGRLVDDLLNFSQLGRATLAPTRVDMTKLVDEVMRSRETELQARSIKWTITALPPAWGDAGLLRQVWTNLIDNAIKYTAKAVAAEITIRGDLEGDVVAYTVSDNGAGFDMAYVGKLFGVFQRLHRMEDFAGTGIGLALSKRIVERHGGSISATGETGKGATFVFKLPKKTEKTVG